MGASDNIILQLHRNSIDQTISPIAIPGRSSKKQGVETMSIAEILNGISEWMKGFGRRK